MKKFVLFIFLFFVFSIPAFADYKPIPKELSKQYKKEIENTIKTEFNIRYNNIKTYDNQILAAKPENRYIVIDMGLQSEIFDFYMALINITDKYINIKENISTTDFWIILSEIMEPYFKDNNINTRLVDKLILYSEKKEQYLKKKYLTKDDYLRDFAYLDSIKNCYNLRSFKYNKLKRIYKIDMAINIAELEYSDIYKYSYQNGYITHLIFKTKLQDDNIYVKYKGFVAHNIDKNGSLNDVIMISTTKPLIIKNNIKNLEYTFVNWIDKDNYIYTVKTLANNLKD